MMRKKRRSPSKRPRQTMPAFVRAALEKKKLMAAYRERPPYQRNDYLGWINGGAREATRQKRLAQMLKELARGDTYMNMDWRAIPRPVRPLRPTKRSAKAAPPRGKRKRLLK